MHDLGETRYAQTVDGGHIAYRVMGHGGLDLVLMTDEIIPAEALVDEPSAARVLDRLASFGRVVLFDRRGTGLSDPISPFRDRGAHTLKGVPGRWRLFAVE